LARRSGRTSSAEAPVVPIGIREQRADAEQRAVEQRRAGERPAHVDPARDREQRAEQRDERDVCAGALDQPLDSVGAEREREIGQDRQRERERDQALVAIAVPEVRRRERQDRDHASSAANGIAVQTGSSEAIECMSGNAA